MRENKVEWMLGLVVLVLVAFLAGGRYLPVGNTATPSPEKQVVIDAGHGGIDPGKIGINDAKEKDINLQIARYLQEYLEKQGVAVVMTRETDEGLYGEYASNKKREDMQKRCAIIKETDPTVAVSIHQNSYHDGGQSGCQVFYYKQSEEGEKLAKVIQQTMTEQLKPAKERQVKANDSYYMLRHTVAPTVIVECGFLSNWEEAQRLLTEEYQKQVAQAIGDGILAYLDS